MRDADSMHRAAAVLRPALIGQPMMSFVSVRVNGPEPLPGTTVEAVAHERSSIVLTWDDGTVLDVRLRRRGMWEVYRPGERWRGPAPYIGLIIEVPEWTAVCYHVGRLESYRDYDPRRHPVTGTAGPDLRRPDADLAACAARMAHHPQPEVPIAEVLLDERVAVGLTNAWRSEALFRCGIHPLAPVGELAPEERLMLLECAAGMVRTAMSAARLAPELRHAPVFAVYGRAAKRCRRCTDVVETASFGTPRRAVYWCPSCQQGLGRWLAPLQARAGDHVVEMASNTFIRAALRAG